MKKFLGILFSVLFVMFPLIVKAENEKVDVSKYNTLGLREALADEEIEAEFSEYSETNDQVIIYLFRGKGCGYCRAFLTFLNSITNEYGKYFKVVSFESWYDSDNADLLTTISNFLGQPAGGVPYIVIGDKVFPGYASNYDDEIKSTILELYDSTDRYDVIEEYNNSLDAAKKEANSATTKIIIWDFLFTVIAAGVVIYYIHSSNERMMVKIKDTMDKNQEQTVNLVKARKEDKKDDFQSSKKTNKKQNVNKNKNEN